MTLILAATRCEACVKSSDPVCEYVIGMKCEDFWLQRGRAGNSIPTGDATGRRIVCFAVDHSCWRLWLSRYGAKVKRSARYTPVSDKVIAFMMEVADAWDELPACIVVKGVVTVLIHINPRVGRSMLRLLLLRHQRLCWKHICSQEDSHSAPGSILSPKPSLQHFRRKHHAMPRLVAPFSSRHD